MTESKQSDKPDFILTGTDPLMISCWAPHRNLILFFFIVKPFFNSSTLPYNLRNHRWVRISSKVICLAHNPSVFITSAITLWINTDI